MLKSGKALYKNMKWKKLIHVLFAPFGISFYLRMVPLFIWFPIISLAKPVFQKLLIIDMFSTGNRAVFLANFYTQDSSS